MRSALCATVMVGMVTSFGAASLAADVAPWSVAQAAKPAREKSRDRKAKQDEALQADRDLNAALARGDIAAIERLLASSFVLTYAAEVVLWNDGSPIPTEKTVPARKLSRDQVVSGLKSGQLKITTVEWSSVAATLAGAPNSALGDKAVVGGRLKERSSFRGKDTSGEFVVNRTYVKQDGRWQCTEWSANPLVLRE